MENKKKDLPKKTFKLCCHFCGKEYVKRTCLEKHTLLCEIIFKTNHNKHPSKPTDEDEDEDEKLPSQKRLYQMLIELGIKYNRLEEKVEEMSKVIIKQRKKINILDWLNTNLKPEIIFDKLHEVLQITEEDIEYLFHNTFLDTLNMIFSRTIYGNQNNPILSFQHKQGFYIYDQNQPFHYCWIPLSREKLIQFLNRCHRKISKALSDWKKMNTEKIKDNDKYAVEYDKTMSKLMNVDFKQDNTFNKVKSTLHNHLKLDMKNIVEYEIEF